MEPTLENAVRAVFKRRMRRGLRDKVAEAAEHEDGSWVSNWMARRQKHATLDELHAMAKALGLSLAKIISLHEAKVPVELISAIQDPWTVAGVEALEVLGASDPDLKRLTVQTLRATARLPSVRPDSAPTGETIPVKSTKPAQERRR